MQPEIILALLQERIAVFDELDELDGQDQGTGMSTTPSTALWNLLSDISGTRFLRANER